jgi:excisionase family DNA binding protein
MQPITLTAKAAKTAREIGQQLDSGTLTFQSNTGKTTLLPAETLDIFREVLEQLASQRPVVILTLETELSTFETAEILNVSRPFVTKLLEHGEIPFHMVGSHHRVKLADVLTYQSVQRQRSLEAMRELAELSQELGLYDQ